MPEIPPPPGQGPYAAYPRYKPSGDDPASTLAKLSEGYYGLNTAFFLNILIIIGFYALIYGFAASGIPKEAVGLLTIVALLGAYIGATVVYRPTKVLGEALDWAPPTPLIASIATVLCCGLIGYMVMQGMAAKKMKSFGVRSSLFGIRKRDVEAMIAQLQAQQNTPGAPYQRY